MKLANGSEHPEEQVEAIWGKLKWLMDEVPVVLLSLLNVSVDQNRSVDPTGVLTIPVGPIATGLKELELVDDSGWRVKPEVRDVVLSFTFYDGSNLNLVGLPESKKESQPSTLFDDGETLFGSLFAEGGNGSEAEAGDEHQQSQSPGAGSVL